MKIENAESLKNTCPSLSAKVMCFRFLEFIESSIDSKELADKLSKEDYESLNIAAGVSMFVASSNDPNLAPALVADVCSRVSGSCEVVARLRTLNNLDINWEAIAKINAITTLITSVLVLDMCKAYGDKTDSSVFNTDKILEVYGDQIKQMLDSKA